MSKLVTEKLCGECWLENGEIICANPEEHFKLQNSEHEAEEQLDLFCVETVLEPLTH